MDFLRVILLAVSHHIVVLTAAKEEEPFLVFTTWLHLSRMNLDGSEYSVIIDNSNYTGLWAVDYHPRLNKIYWTHYRSDTIHEADLDGSNPSVIISDVNRPRGLAVDWLNDVIYFSFSDFNGTSPTPNHLAVYNISSGSYTEITTLYAVYYDVAVDPTERKLYWTAGSKIIQSSLSGENAEVIHTTACLSEHLVLTNGLFFTENCIMINQSIYFLNITTHRETLIYTSTSSDDFFRDVTAYADSVYWTGLGRVYSAPINGSGPIAELLHISFITSTFRGIILVQPQFNVAQNTSLSDTPSVYPQLTNTPTTPGKEDSSETSGNMGLAPLIGGVLGATLTIVCVFLVVLALLFWMRKRQSPAPKIPDTDFETSQNPVYGAFDSSKKVATDAENYEGHEAVDPNDVTPEDPFHMRINEVYSSVEGGVPEHPTAIENDCDMQINELYEF